MPYIELVAILAVLQFFFFGAMTGRARVKSGIEAPATTGDEGFERMYRVQMNTLELLIAFLPALFIAGKYWPSWLVAGLGVIYIIGRFLFWRGYVAEPAKRTIGFMLSMFPTLLLILLSVVGVVMTIFGT